MYVCVIPAPPKNKSGSQPTSGTRVITSDGAVLDSVFSITLRAAVDDVWRAEIECFAAFDRVPAEAKVCIADIRDVCPPVLMNESWWIVYPDAAPPQYAGTSAAQALSILRRAPFPGGTRLERRLTCAPVIWTPEALQQRLDGLAS